MATDSPARVVSPACQDSASALEKWRDVVTLLVGPDEEVIRSHTFPLTRESRFFAACLRGPWTESKDRIVRLPDISPENFVLYLQWAYHGILDGCVDSTATSMSAVKVMARSLRNQYAAARYVKLGKLAILADNFDDCSLKNAVVDAIIIAQNKFMFVPSPDVLHELWENLPQSSKIRNLLAKMFATLIDVKNLIKNRDRNPPGLIFDAMVMLRTDKLAGGLLQAPTIAERCNYHEHPPNHPKCPLMTII